MRLTDLTKNRVIALDSLPGAYVRDLPAKQLESLFKPFENMEEPGEDDEMTDAHSNMILAMFNTLVCDDKGEPFEDLIDVDIDELSSVLSVTLLWDIVNEIPMKLLPQGVDMGKSKRTGGSK